MNKNDIPQITFKEIKTRNDLFCQFDDHNGVLLLDVVNSFIEDDFKTIASIIDPYFSTRGELEGIIINSKKLHFQWVDFLPKLLFELRVEESIRR